MVQTKEDADLLFEAAHAQYDVARRQGISVGRVVPEEQTATKQYNDALEDFKQARAIYQQLSDWYGEAQTLFHIGLVYEGLKDVNEIPHAYEDALAILRDKNQNEDDSSRLLIAKVYNNLGVFHSNRAIRNATDLNIYEEAIESAFKNYKLAYDSLEVISCQNQVEVHLEWGKVFNNLGRIYKAREQWTKSLECYKEALFYYQDITDFSEASVPESVAFYNVIELVEYLLDKFKSNIYPQGGARHHSRLESETIQDVITLAERILLRPNRLHDKGSEGDTGGGGYSTSGCHRISKIFK